MSASPNYSPTKAIEQAVGCQPPPPPTDSYWNSPRSGLEVKIGALSSSPIGGQPDGVPVALNGFVDAADALHLENFFRKLKEALPPLRHSI